MKKDVKALIKRLTLLVQFKRLKKGWISIDGSGGVYICPAKPIFYPRLLGFQDYWYFKASATSLSDLDNLPLSMVCPSLTSKEALFYTDGETVWLVETR